MSEGAAHELQQHPPGSLVVWQHQEHQTQHSIGIPPQKKTHCVRCPKRAMPLLLERLPAKKTRYEDHGCKGRLG